MRESRSRSWMRYRRGRWLSFAALAWVPPMAVANAAHLGGRPCHQNLVRLVGYPPDVDFAHLTAHQRHLHRYGRAFRDWNAYIAVGVNPPWNAGHAVQAGRTARPIFRSEILIRGLMGLWCDPDRRVSGQSCVLGLNGSIEGSLSLSCTLSCALSADCHSGQNQLWNLWIVCSGEIGNSGASGPF